MDNFFAFVLFISFILFIVGLIKPKLAFSNNRKTILKVYPVIIFVSFIGFFITADPKDKIEEQVSPNINDKPITTSNNNVIGIEKSDSNDSQDNEVASEKTNNTPTKPETEEVNNVQNDVEEDIEEKVEEIDNDEIVIGEIESKLKQILSSKDFNKVTTNQIMINKFQMNDGEYIVLPHLKWEVQNGKKTTRAMLKNYSDTIANELSEEFSGIKEITIFWEVPYHLEGNNIAKFNYSNIHDGKAIMDDWFAPLLR